MVGAHLKLNKRDASRDAIIDSTKGVIEFEDDKQLMPVRDL